VPQSPITIAARVESAQAKTPTSMSRSLLLITKYGTSYYIKTDVEYYGREVFKGLDRKVNYWNSFVPFSEVRDSLSAHVKDRSSRARVRSDFGDIFVRIT